MPTSIRLDAATEQRLNYLTSATGRSKAFYLRELVERGLDDLEDYYLAENTMQRVYSGEEKTYSLDDVEHELGLAD